MKITRKDRLIAQTLADASFENGKISEERVRACMKIIAERSPIGQRNILNLYLKKLNRMEKDSQVIIEYAGELDPEIVQTITQQAINQYKRPLTPITKKNEDIIAGIRFRVGDDLYENSIRSRLEKLKR